MIGRKVIVRLRLTKLLRSRSCRLLESGKERLPILEPHHRANVIDGVGGKPLILQVAHRILNAVGVHNVAVRHTVNGLKEPREGKCRNPHLLRQLLGREIRGKLALPPDENGINTLFMCLQLIHFGHKVKNDL